MERETAVVRENLSHDAAERAQVELAKFFALVDSGVPDLTMISPFVDEVWHELVDRKDEYDSYCAELVGTHVVHSPIKGEGVVSWINEYEARFGRLDPVWFMDKTGDLDEDRWQSYLAGFQNAVRASWDCTPVVEPDRKVRASWDCTPVIEPDRKVRASWDCTPVIEPDRKTRASWDCTPVIEPDRKTRTA